MNLEYNLKSFSLHIRHLMIKLHHILKTSQHYIIPTEQNRIELQVSSIKGSLNSPSSSVVIAQMEDLLGFLYNCIQ